MTGTIVQVNTSRGGVPKRPILGGMLQTGGIEGDMCAHPKFHGGPKQAVLIILTEVLDGLREAGYPVFPGALGENLTVSGLDRTRIRIGQQFQAGEAVVEITKLRVPCDALNVYNSGGRVIQKALYDARCKAGDPGSPVWGKGGFYASVVRTGFIRPNDIITLSDPGV